MLIMVVMVWLPNAFTLEPSGGLLQAWCTLRGCSNAYAYHALYSLVLQAGASQSRAGIPWIPVSCVSPALPLHRTALSCGPGTPALALHGSHS
jgi:hypothetical protein